MNFSTTYTGLIVAALATFLPKFGVMIGTEELTTTITTVLTLLGGILAFYGRFKAGGISLLGFKKTV